MTKQEAQDRAIEFVHDVYNRQMEDNVAVWVELTEQAYDMRETGDCSFYIGQLTEIRQLIDELITSLKHEED